MSDRHIGNTHMTEPKQTSICHVAVGDLWAGAEVQLKVLLSKLVLRPELNLSAILFNGGRLGEEIERLGIPVAVFPEAEWGSGKMFLELVRKFRQSDTKIVHTHKYKDTVLAAPAAKLCGIPYVVRTVHGLREPFEGLRAFKMSLYESIERTVHRRCVNAMIGVSSQIQGRCKAEGAVSKVVCIRNGIDLDGKSTPVDRDRMRRELHINPGTCLIGTVGRLTPVKGLSYLLQSMSILLRQRMNVRLLIVGDGVIRKGLEAQARDLGIGENVVFLGHREDTEELLQALDIFVLPSLNEGIPMALLEAMAASRAVVASCVGGIPEIVENGVEGILVEPMDVTQLAESCGRLIESPEIAVRMGEQARRKVVREFSATAMADQVAVLYKGLVGPQ